MLLKGGVCGSLAVVFPLEGQVNMVRCASN